MSNIFSYSSGGPPTGPQEAGGRLSEAGHPVRQAEEAGPVPGHPAGAPHHPAARVAVRLPVLHAGHLRPHRRGVIRRDVRLHAWSEGAPTSSSAAGRVKRGDNNMIQIQLSYCRVFMWNIRTKITENISGALTVS